MSKSGLLEVVDSIGGLKVEIWGEDLEHAILGHPEVTIQRVKETLSAPSRVVQSKSSNNACLFYSIEIKGNDVENIFFCVVVAVKDSGVGKIITAYETDFMKTGKELFSKEVKNES
ncbi:hypothetical protein EZJ49_11960 [Bdellovibrio bacteriovorus]|uniref:hypothetical protein n=1 Tax=Bdellovibrio bacteriovorus TaxID=959 RepID=UPI0021CE1BA0|nr:hypothetical protein [Bdellovibrio bacteriovorus]UXR63779.1 hypothetical protein EZJ49_11960 [Bdellovibrio bacteriovorus]